MTIFEVTVRVQPAHLRLDGLFDRAQFEAAYRALVQLTHGLRLIEVKEGKRWGQKITATDSSDPEKRDGTMRWLNHIAAAADLCEVMRTPDTPPVSPVDRSISCRRAVPSLSPCAFAGDHVRCRRIAQSGIRVRCWPNRRKDSP